jgi:type IV pilus assembly protein PilM
MLGSIFRIRPYLVGLDIGSSYIKVLELTRGRKGLLLGKIGCVRLNPEYIVEKDIIDSREVAREIRSLFAEIKPSRREAAISVSGSKVMTRLFEVPFMPEQNIPSYIKENFASAFPFKLDDVYLDFAALRLNERGLAQVEISAAAAKREFVDEYVRVVELAGLKVRTVDLDALALYNAFQHSQGPDFDGQAIVVHTGHSRTLVIVADKAGPLTVQDFPLGGKGVIERIQLATGTGPIEAADMLEAPGLPTEQALGALETFIGELFEALEFTLGREGFRLTDPGTPVYLSGGLACLEPFRQAFQLRTPARILALNPFARIGVQKDKFDLGEIKERAPLFSVAFGLGLHEIKEVLARIRA